MRFVILLLLSIPAFAQTSLVDPANPGSVVAALQKMAYQAKLERDSTGDPMIRSSTQGSNYSIIFYGCTDNADCEGMNFARGFDIEQGWTLSAVNDWNRRKLIGKAHLDDESDPFIRHYVEAKGGLPFETFEEFVRLWGVAMADFKAEIPN